MNSVQRFYLKTPRVIIYLIIVIQKLSYVLVLIKRVGGINHHLLNRIHNMENTGVCFRIFTGRGPIIIRKDGSWTIVGKVYEECHVLNAGNICRLTLSNDNQLINQTRFILLCLGLIMTFVPHSSGTMISIRSFRTNKD